VHRTVAARQTVRAVVRRSHQGGAHRSRREEDHQTHREAHPADRIHQEDQSHREEEDHREEDDNHREDRPVDPAVDPAEVRRVLHLQVEVRIRPRAFQPRPSIKPPRSYAK